MRKRLKQINLVSDFDYLVDNLPKSKPKTPWKRKGRNPLIIFLPNPLSISVKNFVSAFVLRNKYFPFK